MEDKQENQSPSSSQDLTFLTRQNRKPTTFELKYLEKFGKGGDRRIGLPGLSPELVDKQDEMEQVNKNLENARAKFEQWKTNLQAKKKEIEAKKEKLAEEKHQLDQFTVVHTAELEKCREREKQENKMIAEMESELEELSVKEEQLRKKNDDLSQELSRLQPCADYLQSVVESGHKFDNIDAILNRHAILAATREEYIVKYQELLQQMGVKEREAEEQLLKEKNLLIDLTMRYNGGVMAFESAKKVNEYKKTTIIKEIQRVEEKSVEVATIETSINAIYKRALAKASQTGISKVTDTAVGYDARLVYIQNRFTDLAGVIEEWKNENH